MQWRAVFHSPGYRRQTLSTDSSEVNTGQLYHSFLGVSRLDLGWFYELRCPDRMRGWKAVAHENAFRSQSPPYGALGPAIREKRKSTHPRSTLLQCSWQLG